MPGTQIRFGLDPLLSLLPGLGELVSPVFAALILTEALRRRVPGAIILKMIVLALIDAAIGAVPVAGTVADVFWRANKANLALLEQHAGGRQRLTRRDYLVFWSFIALFGLLVGGLAILGIWVAWEVWPRLIRL